MFFYLRRNTKRSVAQVQKEAFVLHLSPFVVNLADEDHNTFLRVEIDLAVSASASKAGTETSTALIRDTLLETLMAAKSEEVASAEGKRKLKDEMLRRLNARAPGLNVQEIYFTEFLIQK